MDLIAESSTLMVREGRFTLGISFSVIDHQVCHYKASMYQTSTPSVRNKF